VAIRTATALGLLRKQHGMLLSYGTASRA